MRRTSDQPGDQLGLPDSGPAWRSRVHVLTADDALYADVLAALPASTYDTVRQADRFDAGWLGGDPSVPAALLVDDGVAGGAAGAIRRIRRDAPDTVVVLARRADPEKFLELLRVGVRGYVVLDDGLDRLSHVIDDVLAGDVAIPRTMSLALCDAYRHPDRHHRREIGGKELSALTDAEYHVLELLAAGASTATMARELFVSPVTVRTHLRAILHKLRLPDRDALIDLCDAEEARVPMRSR